VSTPPSLSQSIKDINGYLADPSAEQTPKFMEGIRVARSKAVGDVDGLDGAEHWWKMTVERDAQTIADDEKKLRNLAAKYKVALPPPAADPIQSSPEVRAAIALRNEGKSDQALGVLKTIFGEANSDSIQDFEGRMAYAVLLLDSGSSDDAKDQFAKSLRDAQGTSHKVIDQTGHVVVYGDNVKSYDYYNGPEVSGAMGYGYAEASTVGLVLQYWGCMKDKASNPIATAIFARSLASLGDKMLAPDLAQSALDSGGENDSVLAAAYETYRQLAMVQKANETLAKLKLINPRHPIVAKG